MIITALLAFSIAQSTVVGLRPPAWVATGLDTQTARGVLKTYTRAKGASAKSQTKKSGTQDERPNNDPVFAERIEASNTASSHVGQLLMEGRTQEADKRLFSFLAERPELRGLMTSQIVDCELLLGRYDEAYRELLNWVSTCTVDDPNMYLKLSFVCAARGEIYPGQMQYCQDWLQKFYSDEHIGEPPLTALQLAENPRSAMFLSCVAIGMNNTDVATSYLELAFKFDPKNELAASEAILRYLYQGRYSDIRRVASAISNHLPPGVARDKFQKEIADVANLKDKPVHRIDVENQGTIRP
jgi:tetratricopeptide (TPR) repeat protein